MYENIGQGGSFGDYSYWSSTEDDNGYAWRQYFNNGAQNVTSKSFTNNVRAVRAF